MKTTAAILAILLLGCDGTPDVKTERATKRKLPPWTLVCDDSGRWNFTWDNGEINPFTDPQDSAEAAAERMVWAKKAIEITTDKVVRPQHPTEGYKVCEPR